MDSCTLSLFLPSFLPSSLPIFLPISCSPPFSVTRRPCSLASSSENCSHVASTRRLLVLNAGLNGNDQQTGMGEPRMHPRGARGAERGARRIPCGDGRPARRMRISFPRRRRSTSLSESARGPIPSDAGRFPAGRPDSETGPGRIKNQSMWMMRSRG